MSSSCQCTDTQKGLYEERDFYTGSVLTRGSVLHFNNESVQGREKIVSFHKIMYILH